MQWDARKKAQDYLRIANAIHPEEFKGSAEFEQELARQDLYYECYMLSFSLEKLKAFLEKSASGEVRIPEDVDGDVYVKQFSEEARQLLTSITG